MARLQRVAPSRRANRVAVCRRLIVIAAVLGCLATAAPAPAQDVARGRQLFQLCAICHGEHGQGDARFGAPVIAGLPSWYLVRQLTNFKQGIRAYRAEDTRGLQMRPMARSLVTDADVAAVAAYVTGLKAPLPPATLAGDAGRGQAAYAVCMACHGPQARGNEAVGAPALTGQADWYLVAQLKKFKEGLRGTQGKDVTGAQMRAMSMTLADEQAMADVVAYIRSLGR